MFLLSCLDNFKTNGLLSYLYIQVLYNWHFGYVNQHTVPNPLNLQLKYLIQYATRNSIYLGIYCHSYKTV